MSTPQKHIHLMVDRVFIPKLSSQTKSKSTRGVRDGRVFAAGPDGVGLIEDAKTKKYGVFLFGMIDGYEGQPFSKLGLRDGTKIRYKPAASSSTARAGLANGAG